MAKVRLQQQVGLCVGAVVGVGVDLQGELLSQLAVQLVLVVSDRQLGVLLRVLKEEGSAVSAAPRLRTRVKQSNNRGTDGATLETSAVFRLLQVGSQRSEGQFNVLKHFGSSFFLWKRCCKILFSAPPTHRNAAVTNENLQTCS